MPDVLLHSTADSTAVPSNHWLKVVISCHCAPEATIWQMAVFHAPRSRGSRGAASVGLQ
ncbi:MAG: hypothetical protein DLM71_02465 [Chloroflexi bacterium]|nr:MAG: hypothetical protein DLM71_02465 [Chloroflexota bacterium]